MIDTDSMPLDPTRKKRVSFDPTVNLGHLLTFIGFIVTGAVGYFDLRERISVQEIRHTSVATELDAEKARTRETLGLLRDDMREVRRGVEDLLRSNHQKLGK